MESMKNLFGDVNDSVSNPVNSSSFDGQCGLAACAGLGKTWFGYPKLTISLMNPSEKEIEAIAFYLLPYNMYGEEIEGPAISNKLCADTPIPTGESDVISYRLRDRDIKMVQLYVYHVLYSDGTQWGNQNADRADILEDGILIWVSGQL